MKIPHIKKVIAPVIVFAIAVLLLLSAQNWLSSASSALQSHSQTSASVAAARLALETALASEKKNPAPEAARTTDTAFFQYKTAVDERLAEIRTTQADLRKRDTTGAFASQIATLEREHDELESSLGGYLDQIKALRGSRKPDLRSPVPAVVFTGGAITLNTGTAPVTSTPYPSTINVSGLTGVVSNITVTLTNLSTTRPDDFDLLLVGPTGANAMIMSDVGGTSCANCPVTLVLDDAAATQLPNNGPPVGPGLSSGTFQPANFNGGDGDTFPAPAPTPSGLAPLSVFNGTDPNGTWSLYVVNDGGTVGGSIASWSIDITAGAGACTLTCPMNITQAKDANACGAVVTYPAPTTSGACGTVTCIPPSGSFFPVGTTTVNCSETTDGATCSFTVTVTGVCPAGQVCNNNTITINDNAAAAPYPSTIEVSGLMGQIVSKVTVTLANFSHDFPDDVDILLVGPQGQEATIMSDVGSSLSISSNAPVTLTLDDAAATALPDSAMLSTGTFQPTNIDPGMVGDTFPAPAPTPSGGSALSVFNGSDPNGTWSLFIVDDGAGSAGMLGGWCLNITTTTPTPCMLTCPMNVTQAKDPNFCGAVVTYPAPTTSGTCGTVTCTPPSGSFFPVGTTTVMCSEPGGENCSFSVTVTGTCDAGQVCNNSQITINDNAAATPYPSTIAISGVAGVVEKVTVTLANFNHDFPDDVDVLLVGPQGQTAIIMSDVGGSNPISINNPVTLTLDDAAATALPDTGMLSTGTFQPTNIDPGAVADTFPAPAPTPSGGAALSVFNGTDPNGTWSLFVVDDGMTASGLLGGWCLNITAACALTCPEPITVANDAGQCGAVVSFAPTTSGPCGMITCAPPSGSFFPVGTTTVMCSEPSGGNCSFTVTVNDTEPPQITCPPPQTSSTGPLNYPDPTVTDNCPGATFVCDPPSGSVFPMGTSTVTCTATDAAGNTATCSFIVTTFDVSVEGGTGTLMINTQTGNYQFCCAGMIVSGVGRITVKGCTINLQQGATETDRRLNATIDTCRSTGTASLQMPPGTLKCTITDRNIGNNNFDCPGSNPTQSQKK